MNKLFFGLPINRGGRYIKQGRNEGGQGGGGSTKTQKEEVFYKNTGLKTKTQKTEKQKMRLFGLLCPAGGYSAGWALCLMFIFAEFLVVLLIFSTCGTAGGFWGLLGSLGSLIGVFFGRISGVVLFFLVVPGVLPDRFFLSGALQFGACDFSSRRRGGVLGFARQAGLCDWCIFGRNPGVVFFCF